MHAAEKMAKDVIDEQPLSWIESPEKFSVSSNKRQHSEYGDSVT